MGVVFDLRSKTVERSKDDRESSTWA